MKSSPSSSEHPTNWPQQLRQVTTPRELATLALKCLGIDDDLLLTIFGTSGLRVDEALRAGLALGRDSPPPPQMDAAFNCAPIGIVALGELLSRKPSFQVKAQQFQLEWEPFDKMHKRAIKDGKVFLVQESTHHLRLKSQPEFQLWSEGVRQLFLHSSSNLELLIVLPLPSAETSLRCWHELTWPQQFERGHDGALRLCAGLSILGLSHNAFLKRTLFLSGLVAQSEFLFDEVGIGGSTNRRDRPQDALLGEHAKTAPKGALSFRYQPGKTAPTAHPLVLNFSGAWQGNPNRFDKWSIRDRGGDADEVANALLHLVAQTSGVFLRLPLTPRQAQDDDAEHAVRLVGPKPWIDFVSQGHGEKRHGKIFEPYRLRDQEGISLFCIDEPLSYEELKKLREQKKATHEGNQ